MSQARHQASNQRFNAFFNRLTKARLSGAPLAPALAEAVGTELAQLNPATDLPPDAAKLWTGFLETYITFSGSLPGDPLAKLRALPQAEAEDAMGQIGEIQALVADAAKKGR